MLVEVPPPTMTTASESAQGLTMQICAEVGERLAGERLLASAPHQQPEGPTKMDRTAASQIIHAFHLLVASHRQLHPSHTRAEAIAAVSRREPALHALYLRATNPRAAWG